MKNNSYMKRSIMTSDRLDYMDVGKGIAISMVILCHFVARIPNLNIVLAKLGAFGQMGCQLFFVISAFFAMQSLEHNTTHFIKRKLRRILPMFYIAMIPSILATIILRDVVGVEMNFARTETYCWI